MYVGTLNTIPILMTSVYICLPTIRVAQKLDAAGEKVLCTAMDIHSCTGGQFHPGKMMVWKFRPSVVYLRYMSTVDEKLKYLFRNKLDCIYNFKTKQYVHLRDTPIRDRYERFAQSKNNYLKNPNIWF